ncbi:DUF4389 domain-containing protein [Desulfovibrio oxyclinae]|uniref:DUF4389 domain-containing protein n=1 Tax=Desulfovibrio oxyclinae TaxID=63560 RepID=UPI0003759DD2|nr:DUF4389 domain-containing protein [Desulfovibrio oxyclinae]
MPKINVERTGVLKRLAVTIVCLLVFELVRLLVQVSALFQYAWMLISKSYSAPLRNFNNRLSLYAYRLLRYATLNENARPFPFEEFPSSGEPAEEPEFDKE